MKYHAIAACTGTMEQAREHLQQADDGIEDICRVLKAEDRDDEYIEERLSAVMEMVLTVEANINEDVSESCVPRNACSKACPY